MNKVLMSTILLCVALNATPAVQTEKAPQPPEMEEAVYVVKDNIHSEPDSFEVWRKYRNDINIYYQGKLAYVGTTKEMGVGREDTGIPIGAPYLNKILFPVNPKTQPHGAIITAKHLTIEKGSTEAEESVMTVTVKREPNILILTYEVHDGEHMNRTIRRFSPTSDLPTTVEFLYFHNGELMEHQVKTKQK